MVTQDPLRAKLREILPDATESDLSSALQHMKNSNMDLQQLEHMKTSRIRELFRSDTPTVRDHALLSRRPARPTPKNLSVRNHAMLAKITSFDIEKVRSPIRPEKKKNRNFIEKIKNAFRRKK